MKKVSLFHAISANDVTKWAALTDRAYARDAFREYRSYFYRWFTL